MKSALRLLGAVLVAAFATLPAWAAEYPSRPILLIVGYPPGASTDFSARALAASLTPRLGQPVVVENKPGAAAAVGAEFVARAAPDGYTLLYGNNDAIALLPAVKPNLAYRVPDDFTFIARDAQFPYVLASSAKLPFRSVADLVAYARANPGKLRFASTGIGGASHVVALMFAGDAGIQMTHVPYRGAAPAVNDLLGGFVDLIFDTQSHITPFAQAGKVRLLAVTTPTRQAYIPDVPTMAEAGHPGVVMTGWFGVLGPAKLPAPIFERLRQAIEASLQEKALQDQFTKVGIQASYLGGAEFQAFVATDSRNLKAVADKNAIRITD